MKYRNAVCRFCGSDDFYAAKRPSNLVGRYCAKCGAFDGWLPEKDVQNFIVAGYFKIQLSSAYGEVQS